MRQQVRRRPSKQLSSSDLEPGAEVRRIGKRTVAMVLPDPKKPDQPAIPGSKVVVNVPKAYLNGRVEEWPINSLELA